MTEDVRYSGLNENIFYGISEFHIVRDEICDVFSKTLVPLPPKIDSLNTSQSHICEDNLILIL